MAKTMRKTFPAVVIGNIPIKGFIEFIDAWKIAAAQMVPLVRMKIHENSIVING
jgi:hypothetical protein